MKHRAALLSALLLLPAAWAAAQGTLEKRKEGTYYLELGEVFLRSDEFDFAPGFYDPDGDAGPAGFSALNTSTGDVFSTDPRVSMGLHRPDGKTTISLTAWQFNAENGFRFDSDIAASSLEPSLALPGLIFVRDGGVNPLEEVRVAHERDLKYFDASWERNLHQSKRHRTRLLVGLKFIQFEERLGVSHLYGTEYFKPTTTLVEFNDRQNITANVTSERLGPKVGIESRYALGKKFRITSRAELSMMEESIVVQYINRAAEVEPGATLGPRSFAFRTFSRAPLGIHDREFLGAMNLVIRDENEHRIVPVGEISIRGAWNITNIVTAGLEYKWLALYDMPSAQKTAETVRDTISPIDIDLVNFEDNDPDNNRIQYNYTVDDIVQRHDVVFDGVNFFLRFNF